MAEEEIEYLPDAVFSLLVRSDYQTLYNEYDMVRYVTQGTVYGTAEWLQQGKTSTDFKLWHRCPRIHYGSAYDFRLHLLVNGVNCTRHDNRVRCLDCHNSYEWTKGAGAA